MAEPVIQQQGADRIVVAAAGRAGHRARRRTSSAAPRRSKCAWSTSAAEARAAEPAPARCRSAPSCSRERDGRAGDACKDRSILTGDNITDAPAGLRPEPASRPCTSTLDARRRPRIMRDVTRENIGKRDGDRAVRKGQGRSASRRRSSSGELGGRFQITGRMSTARGQRHWRCCCAPARWPRRWRSSRSARSARAWAPRTSRRASTRVVWGFAAIAVFMMRRTTCCSA